LSGNAVLAVSNCVWLLFGPFPSYFYVLVRSYESKLSGLN